jgi:ribosomal protein L11 methyltransferase
MNGSPTWPALDVSGILRPDAFGTSAAEVAGGEPPSAERLHAILTGFGIAAVDERSPDLWRIFFHTAVDRDRATAALHFEFPRLSADPVDVPDEDWATRSQADLQAVQVGRIIVAPPWDIPGAGADRDGADSPAASTLVIVVQPSMGFGTGHHATTRLCLAALQEIDVGGRTVIDVGCGSGVLAIAASLLGGVDVLGVDDDPDAVQAARENLGLNPDAHVEVAGGELGALHLVPSRLVLANLTGGLLVSKAADLQRLLVPGGRLILSGFLTHEEADVRGAYERFPVEHRGEEDGWACLTLVAP